MKIHKNSCVVGSHFLLSQALMGVYGTVHTCKLGIIKKKLKIKYNLSHNPSLIGT